MAFKRIVSDKLFWRSVIGLGILFALIYHIITMLFEYGGFDFAQFFEDKLSEGNWIGFVVGTLLAAFAYGFIISYGKFRSKIKNEERNNR